MNNVPKIRRVIRDGYTVTIAYVESEDDCKVGMAFCSNLDNPSHAKGRQIALGRFLKHPISIKPYMTDDRGAIRGIEHAIMIMFDGYCSSYFLTDKRTQIILEKQNRFPRWIAKFLAAWYADVNEDTWQVIRNKGV
jgi:hypothetical protein